MKITIKQNAWGNWHGYVGNRRVVSFACSYGGQPGRGSLEHWITAEEWKKTAEERIARNEARKRIARMSDDQRMSAAIAMLLEAARAVGDARHDIVMAGPEGVLKMQQQLTRIENEIRRLRERLMRRAQ